MGTYVEKITAYFVIECRQLLGFTTVVQKDTTIIESLI